MSHLDVKITHIDVVWICQHGATLTNIHLHFVTIQVIEHITNDDNLTDFEQEILSHREDVEVLEPASLRKVIKESIMKMAKLYA